jgi:hypothetical protein
LRSSRPPIGSDVMKRSVSRMTPILKLRANSTCRPVPRRLRRVHAVHGREVNQARLGRAVDDAGADAGGAFDRREELAAVLGFTRGAGSGRQNFVDLVRAGQPLELRERLKRRGHRLVRQLPAVETAGAQPHHRLFAIDDLKRKIRAYPDDDHVHRIGADVDRGKSHVLRTV